MTFMLILNPMNFGENIHFYVKNISPEIEVFLVFLQLLLCTTVVASLVTSFCNIWSPIL